MSRPWLLIICVATTVFTSCENTLVNKKIVPDGLKNYTYRDQELHTPGYSKGNDTLFHVLGTTMIDSTGYIFKSKKDSLFIEKADFNPKTHYVTVETIFCEKVFNNSVRLTGCVLLNSGKDGNIFLGGSDGLKVHHLFWFNTKTDQLCHKLIDAFIALDLAYKKDNNGNFALIDTTNKALNIYYGSTKDTVINNSSYSKFSEKVDEFEFFYPYLLIRSWMPGKKEGLRYIDLENNDGKVDSVDTSYYGDANGVWYISDNRHNGDVSIDVNGKRLICTKSIDDDNGNRNKYIIDLKDGHVTKDVAEKDIDYKPENIFSINPRSDGWDCAFSPRSGFRETILYTRFEKQNEAVRSPMYTGFSYDLADGHENTNNSYFLFKSAIGRIFFIYKYQNLPVIQSVKVTESLGNLFYEVTFGNGETFLDHIESITVTLGKNGRSELYTRKMARSKTNPAVWSTKLKVGRYRIEAFNRDIINSYITATLKVKDISAIQVYAIPNYQYSIGVKTLWSNNKTWMFPVISFLAVYLILFLIWLNDPYRIFLFSQSRFYTMFDLIPNWLGGKIITSFRYVIIDLLFLENDRTLSRFIAVHQVKFRERHKLLTGNNFKYIPLPINDETYDTLIETPDIENILKYFNGERTVVQLVGNGGTGKTTLAQTIGLWFLDGQNSDRKQKVCLPIFIEEDTTDVFSIIKSKINDYKDLDVNDRFLEILLKRKRILVVFDALSEKSKDTITYVQNIYRKKYKINNLLITTRQKIEVDMAENVTILSPLQLTSDKVVFFSNQWFEDYNFLLLKKGRNLLKISDAILDLFELDSNTEIPVAPILIKIVVERIREFLQVNPLASIEEVINVMPNNIISVYADYLKSIHKHSLLSESDMFKALRAISANIMEPSYIPQDISEELALKTLDNIFPNRGKEVLDILLLTGTLKTIKAEAGIIVKFSLDPIAEYLYAWETAIKLGKDDEAWKNIYAVVSVIKFDVIGFIRALIIRHESTYKASRLTDPFKISKFVKLRSEMF